MENNSTKDSPGVIAPPPLIFLSGVLLGGLIQWFLPFRIFPVEISFYLRIVGIILIVIGFGIVYIAHAKMKRAKTNIEPWKPTHSIITDGIYSFSRNPVYLAMIFMYFGMILIVNSVWILSLIALVLLVMHFGVILREERYLEKKFGEEYLKYKNAVRRWI